jgi:hypothetical protein
MFVMHYWSEEIITHNSSIVISLGLALLKDGVAGYSPAPSLRAHAFSFPHLDMLLVYTKCTSELMLAHCLIYFCGLVYV